jgi:hypothetical protein
MFRQRLLESAIFNLNDAYRKAVLASQSSTALTVGKQ